MNLLANTVRSATYRCPGGCRVWHGYEPLNREKEGGEER